MQGKRLETVMQLRERYNEIQIDFMTASQENLYTITHYRLQGEEYSSHFSGVCKNIFTRPNLVQNQESCKLTQQCNLGDKHHTESHYAC